MNILNTYSQPIIERCAVNLAQLARSYFVASEQEQSLILQPYVHMLGSDVGFVTNRVAASDEPIAAINTALDDRSLEWAEERIVLLPFIASLFAYGALCYEEPFRIYLMVPILFPIFLTSVILYGLITIYQEGHTQLHLMATLSLYSLLSSMFSENDSFTADIVCYLLLLCSVACIYGIIRLWNNLSRSSFLS